MKRTGCILALLGVGFLLLSGVFLVVRLATRLKARAVEVLALDSTGEKTGEPVRLEPGEEYQVGVTVSLTAAPAAASEAESGDPEALRGRRLRYLFPLRYEVRNAQGVTLLRRRTSLEWDEGNRSSILGPAERRVAATHYLDTFPAPAEGGVTVTARLEADRRYGAELNHAFVHLYQPSWLRLLIVPVAILFAMGPVLVFIGVAVYLSGITAGPERSPRPPKPR
ncbi:MAG: hypothetical protein R6V05_10120 [Candidatus Brocadiia bacterium]